MFKQAPVGAALAVPDDDPPLSTGVAPLPPAAAGAPPLPPDGVDGVDGVLAGLPPPLLGWVGVVVVV